MPRPQVTQQRPNAPPVKKAVVDDGWGAVDWIRMLLYGASGSGKTTFAATFPGPIRWYLCSGGNRPGELRSVDTPEYRKKISPLTVRDFDQFGEDAEKVSASGDYATVVLDHASGFSDMVLSSILGKPIPAQKGWGLATQQQYGQLSLKCKEAFKALLNMPCHVVIIAQERTFGGKDAGIDPDLIKPTVGAALTPSLTGWLNPACDYVLQTFKRPRMKTVTTRIGKEDHVTRQRDKGVEYCVRCEPHDTFMTKFRVPRGYYLPDAIPDPTYDKIVSVLKGTYSEE